MPPIPPHARKVFQGVVFDVYQWEQQMFDGSIATFEKVKRPDTVEVIATIGNKILVEDQLQPGDSAPWICLPGGRADQSGDLLAEAPSRELLEETGYASDNWQLWKSVRPSIKVVHQAHYFIAHDCRKVREPQPDAGEKISLREVDIEEFILFSDREDFSAARDLIIDLLKMRLHPQKKEEFRRLLFPDK